MEQINSTRSFQTCAFYNFMDRSSFLMIDCLQNSTVGYSITYSAQRYPNPIPNLFIVTAIERTSVSKDFDKLYFWFPSNIISSLLLPTKHQGWNAKLKLFQFGHFWIYIKPNSVDWIQSHKITFPVRNINGCATLSMVGIHMGQFPEDGGNGHFV